MSDNSVRTLFNVASLATNVLSEQSEGSLIEFTQSTQNVILVTVEDLLTHHAVIPEILKFCTNIYTGYYLQAVALLNNIGNCNVRQTLDRLNTSRSVSSNAKDAANEWIAIESYMGFPKLRAGYTDRVVSLESWDKLKTKLENLDNQTTNNGNESANQKNSEWATEMPHLAQGKIFEVTIENEGKRAIIPVTVRLNPLAVNREMFKAMYATANQNNSWWNRIQRWKDGELATIADMLFVNDLIQERARLLKQDKLKLTEQLEKKRRGNKLSAILTQKTSLATASTISIISKSTVPDIELAVGGKLSDAKVRGDIFARSGLIMLLVVDDMYETVTVYHRGQPRAMELTFGECKSAAKGSGPNVMEILRAFQAGQVPNI